MSQQDYEYFVNHVFGHTADTYEECFEGGIEYGMKQAKEVFMPQLEAEIKKRIPLHEWYKIKDLFNCK